MRILIIDNYDSFTYNLYQYVGEILSSALGYGHFDVQVKRNNDITLEQISALQPDRLIISPGPGSFLFMIQLCRGYKTFFGQSDQYATN